MYLGCGMASARRRLELDRSYLPTRERALPMNEEAQMKNQVDHFPPDEELVPTQLTKSVIVVLIPRIRPFDRQLSHFKSEKTDFVCDNARFFYHEY